MRTRPLILAAAGVLAIGGLAAGTATASASVAPASVAPARAAAPAAFNASAWGWGPDSLMAFVNAKAALNAQYTGCTNTHLTSSLPSGSGWIATVEGTCTGTA